MFDVWYYAFYKLTQLVSSNNGLTNTIIAPKKRFVKTLTTQKYHDIVKLVH